jgi:hypothetical protein
VITMLLGFMVTEAYAWPRFRRRVRSSTVSTVRYSGSPSQVAYQKASEMARRGVMTHLGGGYGGANAEGVGFGSTATAALNNCCFTGQRTVAGSAVVRGRSGYYAVKLYW